MATEREAQAYETLVGSQSVAEFVDGGDPVQVVDEYLEALYAGRMGDVPTMPRDEARRLLLGYILRQPVLRGSEAIRYAEEHGLTLRKHADPTECARDALTVEEAREVAREDPGLIYLLGQDLLGAD